MKRIKYLFLILVSVILVSCNKPLEIQTTYNNYTGFILESNMGYTNRTIFDKFKDLKYVSNIDIINDNVVFTYQNDMTPNRIGLIQDMLPLYMKDMSYVMNVSIYQTFSGYNLTCSKILYYKNGINIPFSSFNDTEKKQIINYVISFTIKDLEIK